MGHHLSLMFEGTDKTLIRRGDWSVVGSKRNEDSMPLDATDKGKEVIVRPSRLINVKAAIISTVIVEGAILWKCESQDFLFVEVAAQIILEQHAACMPIYHCEHTSFPSFC